MLAVEVARDMAKKKPEAPKAKMGRPTSSRNDVTAKIDIEVMKLVKGVAGLKGITVAEYLSDSMRVVAQSDLDRLTNRKPSESRN